MQFKKWITAAAAGAALLTTGSVWADRLQVRLSTAGASTNVGTLATDVGVWWFGRLHGAAFLFYVAVTVIAGARLRWPGLALLLALLAAVPPLVTVPLEVWFRRRGLLTAPAPLAATG